MIPLPKSCMKDAPFVSLEFSFSAMATGINAKLPSAREAVCVTAPTRDLSYLVVGSFAEPAWAHESYGRKIETALELKSHGSNCKIISEEHWTKFLQDTPELPPERQTPIESHSKGDQLIQLQRELDQLRKNQKILVGVLKDGLKPADYRKLMEHLRESALVI